MKSTMKLEPKHLTPYLPYSLKVIMEGKKTNVAWMSTKNIAIIRPDGVGEYKKINWKYAHLNIKPILRPLSDLTKDQNGTTVLDIIEYKTIEIATIDINNQTLTAWKWNELMAWHFDVFGLIEKGLGIDINTLEPCTI